MVFGLSLAPGQARRKGRQYFFGRAVAEWANRALDFFNFQIFHAYAIVEIAQSSQKQEQTERREPHAMERRGGQRW